MRIRPFRLRNWKRRVGDKMRRKLDAGHWWLLGIFRPTDADLADAARLVAQAERLRRIDDLLAQWRANRARREYATYLQGM